MDSSALLFASASKYFFAFWHDWVPMNTAKSLPLAWMRGMNPRLDSSNSRRSVMATSVGHFMATSPWSVLNVLTGSPSTLPPPSTPRCG